MPEICVVGSLNMDFVIPVTQLPREGETILGRDYETIPGGKGANQAVGAARLGVRVRMVGKVGYDAFGETLRLGLEHEGVETSGIRSTTDARTGCAFILVAEQGTNVIVVAPGANLVWTSDDVRVAWAQAAQADLVLLQGEVPLAVNLAAAKAAREARKLVIWNPAPAIFCRELLALTDILVLNAVEVRQLAQAAGCVGTAPETSAKELVTLGPSVVVVTVGEGGAWLVSRDSTRHFPGFSVDAVDSTAAGDAFVAALAVALLQGASMPDAVELGNAAGALAVTRRGAQSSLPRREDLDTIARRHKEAAVFGSFKD